MLNTKRSSKISWFNRKQQSEVAEPVLQLDWVSVSFDHIADAIDMTALYIIARPYAQTPVTAEGAVCDVKIGRDGMTYFLMQPALVHTDTWGNFQSKWIPASDILGYAKYTTQTAEAVASAAY